MTEIEKSFVAEVKQLLDQGIDHFNMFCPPEYLREECANFERDRQRAIAVADSVMIIMNDYAERLDGKVSRSAYDKALTIIADLVAALPADRTKSARDFLEAQP